MVMLTHLIHRPDPDLTLRGRQPFGFRVVSEDTVERIRGRTERPGGLKAVAVNHTTLAPETMTTI